MVHAKASVQRMKPRIVFIHGMFLNSKSWREWSAFFENLGYECEAPAWPYHDGEPADLRANLPPALGSLSLNDLYDHFRRHISGSAEKPVVIGHSLGGLIAQKLLSEDLVRAAVGICSVAPNRMLALDWDFISNAAAITNPLAGDDPFLMTPELFRLNFANMMEAGSEAAWEAYAVHESRQVLRDTMTDDGEIDLTRPHNPLLLVGAKEDKIIPSSLVRRNAHAYEDGRSHHEYREFSDRGHFICGEPGWDEVAVSVSNWLEGHLSALRS